MVRKIGQSFYEWLLLFPFLLTLAPFIKLGSLWFLWILLPVAFCLFGTLVRFCFKTKLGFVQVFLIVALSGVVYYSLFGLSTASIIGFCIAIGTGYRGILFLEKSWSNLLPETFIWGSMLIYLGIYPFYVYAEPLKVHRSLLDIVGLIAIASSLFIINYSGLKRAAHTKNAASADRTMVSKALVFQNRITVMLIIGVILLIASFNTIKNAITTLFKRVIAWIQTLLETSEELPTESEGPSTPPPLPEGFGDISSRSHFMEIIERILMFGLLLIAIAFGFVVLYFGIRSLYSGIMKLKKWLDAIAARADTLEESGFLDEEEKLTRDERSRGYTNKVLDWFKRWTSAKRWDDFSDHGERVRHLYVQAVKAKQAEGYDYKKTWTPIENAENIPDQSAEHQKIVQLYTEVKYGEKKPDDQMMEDYRKKWK